MATEKLISQISTINRALGMVDGVPYWLDSAPILSESEMKKLEEIL